MQKRAAVFIGRMQPPTIGHYAVIQSMKKYISNNPKLELSPVPVVVIIDGKETGKDKVRNPLTASERISFMQASGHANGVKFLSANDAIKAFESVREAGFEPIAIAVGSDRAEKYLNMLNKYFTEPDGKKITHHQILIPRNSSGDEGAADILTHMDDTVPVSMVSGTLARLAVKSGDFEKFKIIVGLEKKDKLAKMMFNKIGGKQNGNA